MGIWKETAAVSAAALLGLFLLPWALTQGPVKAAELPLRLRPRRRQALRPRLFTTASGRCGCWTAMPSGR